jgi:hypothetical protein
MPQQSTEQGVASTRMWDRREVVSVWIARKVKPTLSDVPRYPFSSRLSSLKKRQSVPWAMSF